MDERLRKKHGDSTEQSTLIDESRQKQNKRFLISRSKKVVKPTWLKPESMKSEEQVNFDHTYVFIALFVLKRFLNDYL